MPIYKNEKFVAFTKATLKKLTDDVDGIEIALLASSDGFEIASETVKFTNKQATPDKLAAVSSSLMALGLSLASECGLENGKSIIVDAESGKIALFPLNVGNTSMILLVQSGSSSMLANLLYSSNRCVKAIIEETRLALQNK